MLVGKNNTHVIFRTKPQVDFHSLQDQESINREEDGRNDISDHHQAQENAIRIAHLPTERAPSSTATTNTQVGDIEYVDSQFTEASGCNLMDAGDENRRIIENQEKPSARYNELWAKILSERTGQRPIRNIQRSGNDCLESLATFPVNSGIEDVAQSDSSKDNIVEHRESEAKVLCDSEDKYLNLFKKTPIPLIFAKIDGTISHINDRFVEVFGYAPEEIKTLEEWRVLVYPEEKYRHWVFENWRTAIARAAKEGRDIEPSEYKMTCKNGEVRTVEISGVLVEDCFLATFTDITARRRSERLLKASYERKRKNELLNELIQASLPSKQALTEAARMMGMRFIEPLSCFLVVMNSYRGQSREYWLGRQDDYQPLVDMIVDELSDVACVSWESREGVGVICFGMDPAAEGKAQQIKHAAKFRQILAYYEPDLDVSVGIADFASSLADLGTHFRQASDAIHIGRKMWPHRKTYHYLDLGVFQVLPFISDQKQIFAYVERTLGKLLQHDKKNKVEFMETLEIILLSDNLKQAAGTLKIHYKTLMFRKHRLEEILGVSLDSFASRMALTTALHLMKLREVKDD